MPDITMCQKEGNKCPDKEKCYRYTAHPSFRQSYSKFFVYKPIEGKCEFLWREKEFKS
jgi:hypothetical protein